MDSQATEDFKLLRQQSPEIADLRAKLAAAEERERWIPFDGDGLPDDSVLLLLFGDGRIVLADAREVIEIPTHYKRLPAPPPPAAPTEIPFFAIGNNELADLPTADGETVPCPHCGEARPLSYGTCNGVENRLLGFVKCGDATYLATLGGKLLK